MDPREIQVGLSALGYDVGAVDGLLGPRTRSAVQRFQGDLGLPADGQVGGRTETALRALESQRRQVCLPPSFGHLGRFRLTQYVIAEEPGGGSPTVPVLGASGAVLARVDPSFFCDMALQGTGKLRDGRLLNVTGQYVDVRGRGEYSAVLAAARRLLPNKIAYAGIRTSGDLVTQALAFSLVPPERVGKGWTIQHGMPLDPFRTLAADLGAYATSDPRYRSHGGLVPAGTRVLILELVGRQLPDGTTHDGWCVVADTGGAIFGAHFDVFAGTRALMRQVPMPHIGHVWFEGIESRCDETYSYGQ